MFLLINKPPGPTSHDIVDQLRQITKLKKIGHAGTLDPFAQGLLIMAINRTSTKRLADLLKLDKTYTATLQLNAASTTHDPTGHITQLNKQVTQSKKEIEHILTALVGPLNQTPPIFSAKKINGRKAYQFARQNKRIKLKSQTITIHNLKLKKFNPQKQQLTIEVTCSSGTYIRSLASTIGQQLNSDAYLTKLTRTHIGPFKLTQAISSSKLTPTNWQKYIFPQLPSLPSQTKVLIFGTFDLLHPGHLNFLNQAKKIATQLYVVIARDVNVKKIKGKHPTQNESTRLKNLQSLSLYPILGSTHLSNRYKVINKIKPDIIALGYDQKVNLNELKDKLKKYKLKTTLQRLKPYQPNKYKPSKLTQFIPRAKL